jgi:glycosyltransferase involved in cell wall biosynthesis
MKTILHLISGLGLGGPQSVFLSHQKLLKGLGYKVIPALRPGAKLKALLKDSDPVEVKYRRSSLPIVKTLMSNKIKSLIDRVKPDVLWVHKPMDAMLSRLACPQAKIVLVVHGFQCRHLENADVLIAVSPAVFAHVKAQGRKNLFLLNNFLDFDVSRHPIKWHDPVRFGALGAFRWKKGFTDFVKALSLLERQRKDFKVELCGKGRWKLLVKLMSKYYKLTQLTINPWQNNTDKWMKEKDVIVVPSKQESFGMVVIEAMARGALVIATRSGGPQSLIADGKTGILTEPKDPQGLYEAMMKVLADPSKWTKVREQGRKFVEKNYTLESARKSVKPILKACGL